MGKRCCWFPTGEAADLLRREDKDEVMATVISDGLWKVSGGESSLAVNVCRASWARKCW